MKLAGNIKSKGVFMGVCLMLFGFVNSVSAAGLLTPKNSGFSELDIKEHHVNVVIEDGYAITTIDQTFFNPNGKDLEAIYSFPVPDKAAVSEFTMWIDGKPINGEVLEKKKAREIYEDQKTKNKNTGITEKNGYKIFEISVFPVRSKGETKIRFSYYQPAHVDMGIGRYLYPLEDGGVDEEALAFWTSNEKVTGRFSFNAVIRSGYPIANVRLPNHANAEITQNDDEWYIHMDNDASQSATSSTQDDVLTLNNNDVEKEHVPLYLEINQSFKLNKDIVIYYRHAENLPGAVNFVAHKESSAKRGTFMMTLTPGMDLQPINKGRDWVFILDISGSMKGKYATLAEGVSRSLKNLKPEDRFRIVLFNSQSSELTKGFMNATDKNVKKYIDAVSAVEPNQGTNLYAGLKLGLKSLDSDRTSSLILVTDGVANVGITHQKQFLKLIKTHDVRLFTFIMGNSANQPLLKALTRESHGFALHVSNSDDIIGKVLLAQSKVNFQALHGVSVKISGVKTSDIQPKNIGSIYRGQQLIIFGHYFGNGPVTIMLKGKISGEEKVYTTQFDFPEIADDNPEIERLWAYATIEQLTQEMEDFGETPDMKSSVVDLGVEYSLVSDYTSMVVVEEDVFQELGIEQRNKQRLEKEQIKQAVRSSRPVRNTRVDTNQPMFSGNRPSFGGGAGAFNPISLMIFSPLLWGLKLRKKRGKK